LHERCSPPPAQSPERVTIATHFARASVIMLEANARQQAVRGAPGMISADAPSSWPLDLS
jgi:hypothetical protein